MYEAIGNVPIFEAYRNFGAKFGREVMDYQDFEFWYMKFSRGETDSDYDGNQDPKPKNLLELPLDILDIVIRELSLDQKLMFRKTSKQIMEIIDNQESEIREIALYLLENHTSILELTDKNQRKIEWNYEKSNFDFELFSGKIGGGNCLISGFKNGTKMEHFQKIVKNSTPEELALADFFAVLRNKSLVLEKLDINYLDSDYFDVFHEKMSELTLSRKIKVKHLKMDAFRDQQEMIVLPYLEIEDTVEIFYYLDESDYNAENEAKRIQKLMEMEQWKMAKTRKLSAFVNVFPFEVLRECDHFELEIRAKDMEEADPVKQVIQTLLTSTILQKCKIVVKGIFTNLGFIESQYASNPNSGGVQYFSSNENIDFTLKIDQLTIEIERKSK